MNNHQSLKAEIDAREENFSICINLGRDLLDRKHYRSDEVRSFYFRHVHFFLERTKAFPFIIIQSVFVFSTGQYLNQSAKLARF